MEQPEETKAEAEEGNQQVRTKTYERSVNDGKDYVFNEEAVENFGWIFKDNLGRCYITGKFLRKANEELANAFSFVKSLEISALIYQVQITKFLPSVSGLITM